MHGSFGGPYGIKRGTCRFFFCLKIVNKRYNGAYFMVTCRLRGLPQLTPRCSRVSHINTRVTAFYCKPPVCGKDPLG